tara:strand:- start:830 stop:1135 length:306 start_codon:yes stop_codon:yes gene_type:complete
MNIGSAIISLLPEIEVGKDFEYRNDSDGKGAYLLWHSKTISKPSDSEIDAEVIRLQAEYDAQEYARSRALAYDSIGNQLDLLFHDMTAGKGSKTGEWYTRQ